MGEKRHIAFNKPFFVGKELQYISEAVASGKISANGYFTQKCHEFFKEKFGFEHCFLTSSCTDALEMSALLIGCGPGDEILIPSYTFTSTANPFIMRGGKVIFVDSQTNHPNISIEQIEKLITSKTKAIVVVHYAGMACDMEELMAIAKKNNIIVIEDAAQAIDSYYKGQPLGSFGQLSTFSFHETKNIISGEGGMLVVNDSALLKRAEIIWEKGTNRAAFFRGDVDKYNWVDIGSSFLPSEITSAFLYAQLEEMDQIQKKRVELWNYYFHQLSPLSEEYNLRIVMPSSEATINGHLFGIVCNSIQEQRDLLKYLRDHGVVAVFHYLSLHKSPFFRSIDKSNYDLPHADKFSECLIRLPMFYELTTNEQDYVIGCIRKFFKS